MMQRQQQSGGDGKRSAFAYGFMDDEIERRAADTLVRTDGTVVDFLPLTAFEDLYEARRFCRCILKCQRHKLKKWEEYFRMIALAQVSVKGKRADEFLQAITGILRSERERIKANANRATQVTEEPAQRR